MITFQSLHLFGFFGQKKLSKERGQVSLRRFLLTESGFRLIVRKHPNGEDEKEVMEKEEMVKRWKWKRRWPPWWACCWPCPPSPGRRGESWPGLRQPGGSQMNIKWGVEKTSLVIIIIIIAIVLVSIGWLAMGSVIGRSWGLNIGSYILMTIDLVTDSGGGIP